MSGLKCKRKENLFLCNFSFFLSSCVNTFCPIISFSFAVKEVKSLKFQSHARDILNKFCKVFLHSFERNEKKIGVRIKKKKDKLGSLKMLLENSWKSIFFKYKAGEKYAK
jgi:hypothetical protein